MDGSEFQGSFKWNMSSESLLNQSLELSKHTVFGFFFFPFLFFHSPFSYKILRAEIAWYKFQVWGWGCRDANRIQPCDKAQLYAMQYVLPVFDAFDPEPCKTRRTLHSFTFHSRISPQGLLCGRSAVGVKD